MKYMQQIMKSLLCLILLVIILLIPILVIGYIYRPVPKSQNTNDSNATDSTFILAQKLRKTAFKRDEFTSNVYNRLVQEYTLAMKVSDCYVCTHLPASTAEPITYHNMPLTYATSCSILLTLVYRRSHFEYFYSNYDLMLSDVPLWKAFNLHEGRNAQPTAWFYFFPRGGYISSVIAYRKGLTCKMNDLEKTFITELELRNENMTEAKLKTYQRDRLALLWKHEENEILKSAIQPRLRVDMQHRGKICVFRRRTTTRTVSVGHSDCEHTYELMGGDWEILKGDEKTVPGVYYICGLNAYIKLPTNWEGTCYLGLLIPKMYHIDAKTLTPAIHNRLKRDININTELVGNIFGAMIPSLGIVLNDKKIRSLSVVVHNIAISTSQALLVINPELIQLRSFVLQNRLALDILLAEKHGTCHMLNVSQCCSYIVDNSGIIDAIAHNLTYLGTEAGQLDTPGLYDFAETGVKTIWDWIKESGEGIIRTILMPICIVSICLLVLYMLYALCKCALKRRLKAIDEGKPNNNIQLVPLKTHN